MSEVRSLTRWGPFEVCSVINGKDCHCNEETNTSRPNMVTSQNNEQNNQRKNIKSGPSCGDPPKRLNHAGSVSTLSFPGISSETSNFFNPYSSIAVGRNYILQVAGTQIGIYNKRGRHFATIPVGDNIFYNTTTQQVLAVLYDPYSDRFAIAVIRVKNTDDPADVVDPYIAFAITKGSNPISDGWYRYMLPLDIGTEKLTQLKLGAWHNGIYLSIGVNNTLARVAIINREKIVCGEPLIALYKDVTCVNYVLGIMPPNVSVTLPPESENAYFIDFSLTSIAAFECKVNWSKFQGKIRKSVLFPENYASGDGFANQNEIDVKIAYGPSYNTGTQIQAQYSHVDNKSSYWISATNLDKGLIWLELRLCEDKIEIAQQQTIANPSGFQRFSPSMAVNKSGNVILVATQSSATTFPSTVYFYRFANDPPNLMTKEFPIILGTGSNPDVRYPPNKTTWGFNSAQVDPSDANTFFVCGEWYSSSLSDWWSTTICDLKL